MAWVWAAEHITMGNLVAVKIISPDLARHPVAIARFKREARAAARLRSPYVVQLFDYDIDLDLGPFIAMELLEGESLADRLDRQHIISPIVLSRILTQVGKGLTKAHAAGVVHRDLKPDNIFLVLDEEGAEIAKVLDFGVAKADSPLNLVEGKTADGTLLGTLNYMSPEQAQGREVNHLADLWALAVIAFEGLVGERPFEDPAPGALVLKIVVEPMPVPSRINSSVPRGFDEWWARATDRDPVVRFQTARDLTHTLAAVCDPTGAAALDRGSDAYPNRGMATRLESGMERARASSSDEGDMDFGLGDEPHGAGSALKQEGGGPIAPGTKRKRPVLEIVPSILPPKPDRRLELVPSDAPEGLGEDALDVDSAYYVMQGATTIGPVSLDLLRRGFESGRVPGEALAWRHPWEQWRVVRELLSDQGDGEDAGGPIDGAEPAAPGAVGMPAAAPPAPTRRLGSQEFPPPATGVRAAGSLDDSLREPTYYVCSAGVAVGPVRASLLRCGIEQGHIPRTALIWREGWDHWKPPADVLPMLASWTSASRDELLDRGGIDSVGERCVLPSAAPPPAAPPTLAPNKRGRPT